MPDLSLALPIPGHTPLASLAPLSSHERGKPTPPQIQIISGFVRPFAKASITASALSGLGRMLVPLFLWQRGLIARPMFYISAYFEARRDEYYDGLLSVSRDDDWTGWCRFFLDAVRAQAEDNLAKARGILDLYETMKTRVSEATKSRYAIHALDWIFQYPIFPSNRFAVEAQIPAPTGTRILNALVDHEILEVVRPSAGRRPAVMLFQSVLDIAEGRTTLVDHP